MRRIPFFLLLLALSACQQSNEPVDLQALAGKARGGDNGALSKLVELLAVDANGVNDQAYTIVTELGTAAVPTLLKKVNSADKVQREHVIAALGSLRAQEAIAPISQVLGDKSLGRRYVAAWALGEIGEAAGIPALLSALNDEDAEVRKYATRALIKLNQSAVEPLIAYLATAPPIDWWSWLSVSRSMVWQMTSRPLFLSTLAISLNALTLSLKSGKTLLHIAMSTELSARGMARTSA